MGAVGESVGEFDGLELGANVGDNVGDTEGDRELQLHPVHVTSAGKWLVEQSGYLKNPRT